MAKSVYSEVPGKVEREKLEKEIGDFLASMAEKYPEITKQEVFNWITITPLGHEVVRLVTSDKLHRLMQEVAEPVDAVMLLHNDGWMEVYAPKALRVKAYTMPWWGISDEDSQYLVESGMPDRLNRLMWPHATEKHPGVVSSFHVCLKEVDRGNGPEKLFTWHDCENRWEDKATSPVVKSTKSEKSTDH
jgi:hypothetical protein